MTIEEIFQKLEEKKVPVLTFATGNLDFISKNIGVKLERKQSFVSAGGNSYGEFNQGYEEDYAVITYVPDLDVYIKTVVTEDSYGEIHSNYGYGSQVFPKEKTVLVYE
jgi:hypothetical protein